MRVSLIVAAAENEVIGRDGTLPWRLPEDSKRFKALTRTHVVIAGRKTHDSIVDRLEGPMPERFTVAVTRQRELRDSGTVVFQPDFASALAVATGIEEFAGRDEVFVIGGAQIYADALPVTDRIYLTRVHDTVDGDTRMPDGWLSGFEVVGEEPRPGFTYLTYERG